LNGENNFPDNVLDNDGLPGEFGSNSGSLYISTDQITGKRIKAILRGGNGANGQSC